MPDINQNRRPRRVSAYLALIVCGALAARGTAAQAESTSAATNQELAKQLANQN
ncbi:MAG: hypothetical protein PVH25_15705 [Burkholderiales bacterium]|jgi:hypothetical protein